ncbi:MAG: exonuclease SbcCD subunit D [Lachnospiraceae bacterium]|nr:exonuclease SbcCD subunit D [Lachnospiraceae bacterium]
MKLMHLSDLHLGKRVNEFSLMEDQKDILNKIIQIIDDEQPDAVLIAGDVYDRAVPSAEAVELFDSFLVRLAKRRQETFIISGNHDSPERLSFAGKLIDPTGIHLAPVYNGEICPLSLMDEYGIIDIYMLPFIKPAAVRRFFPEEEIVSYEDAMRVAIGAMTLDETKRNILITHQFVTGAATSDSEELSVGGADQVSAEVFRGFDYVALGHLHRPQNIKPAIRYSGTPLKYSFSEAKDRKSVTLVELKEKGDLSIREIPLVPLRDMKEIKGTYNELTLKEYYDRDPEMKEAYLHITLTDEEDVPDAAAKLRVIYPNLMKLDYDNTRTRNTRGVQALTEVEKKTPMELFSAFYEMQNGQEMSLEQKQYLETLIEGIWEGDA